MKKISLVLIMLIIVGICIPATSASTTTILSGNPSEYIDTGGQSIISGSGGIRQVKELPIID